MNEVKLFSANLNTAISKRGLTAPQAAAKAKVSPSEFRLYTDGICEPDADTLGRIAESLNVKVCDLAGDAPLEFTSFGQELRKLRQAEGLTRNEMSEISGIPYKSLTNYERDVVRHVDSENIRKLEDIFGDKFAAVVNKYGVRKVKKAKAAPKPKPKPKAKAEDANVTRVTKTGGLRREWIKMLNYIQSDAEFRKAIMMLIAHALDGSPITEIPDAPEANLILRMIRDK